MTTAFDALSAALYGLSISPAGAANHDAQRIEQALSRAGYVIVPAGSVREVGESSVCVGQHVLIIDGLTLGQAIDASGILLRHEQRQPIDPTEAA